MEKISCTDLEKNEEILQSQRGEKYLRYNKMEKG